METKLVLVGLACDGPSGAPIRARDEQQLMQLFGGLHTERHALSATATGVTLVHQPLTLPTSACSGVRNYLYSPAASGQSFTFGSVGASGAVVDVTYVPYLGKSDLLWATRKFLSSTGTMPYVLRMPGEYATLNVEHAGVTWSFISRYHGERYNDLLLTSPDGASLTVRGLEPNFPVLQYDGTPTEIVALMERDYDLGLLPLRLETWDPSTLPTFAANLSGGLNGSFSDANMQSLFRDVELPADVSHIVMLAPVTSSMLSSATDAWTNEGRQPRAVFVQARDYVAPTYNWLYASQQAIPFAHPMFTAFVGTTQMQLDGLQLERYAVEAVAIAWHNTQAFNLTNMSLPVVDFEPVLSETDLDLCKSAGYCTLMRYIGHGISVYQGTNMATSPSFLYSSKLAEVYAVAYKYCVQFYGAPLKDGVQSRMEKNLMDLLQVIKWITVEDVSVTFVGDTLYVEITVFLPGEILTISFNVRNS